MNRLIIIYKDKGGTGGTTFARGLTDYFINKKIPIIAIDSDKRNPQLKRFYGKLIDVKTIDISETNGTDSMFNLLSENDRILVDTPAGYGNSLEAMVNELNINEILTQLNSRITMITVISRVMDSINALKIAYEITENLPIDHVVIKNGHYGDTDKFTRYNESKTRKKLQENNIPELFMPDINDTIYDLLDKRSLPFQTAIEQDDIPFMTKQRLAAWQQRLFNELDKIEELL